MFLNCSFTVKRVKAALQNTRSKNTCGCENLFYNETIRHNRKDFSEFDSHTGIMQIIRVSFQCYHICKYVPHCRIQTLNVINKQGSLTDKDEHPSFRLARLNFLQDPHHF